MTSRRFFLFACSREHFWTGVPAVRLVVRILMAAGWVVPASGAPTGDPEQFELYLLVGQSNMAGRGELTEEDRRPDPRVYSLDAKNRWVCQGEPIHFDKPKVAGVGLGFAFAKRMADRKPGVTIGLIPCAVGGTPVEEWKPGAICFERAVERAKIAMKTGTLKGILWHQGEGSAGREERAAAYGQDLKEVAEGFRTALQAPDVPFVAGRLGEFLYTRSGDKSKYAEEVNAQIDTLPATVSRSAVVSSSGLGHNGDELHFDAAALKEFGARYFDVFVALESKP